MLPKGCSGDDEEALFSQAGDCKIAFNPATLVQALGVDDRSHWLVNLVGTDVVQERQGAWPSHFKFIEGGFIE